MKITIKSIELPASEIGEILADIIKAIEPEIDSDGDFTIKFEVEHEIKEKDILIPGSEIIVTMEGRIFGSFKDSKMGDEPNWIDLYSRDISSGKITSYINGDEVKVTNEDEIYSVVEKLVAI